MPVPMAVAPRVSHHRRAIPRVRVTRPARSSAAPAAKIAMSTDTIARRVSYVPVKTAGTESIIHNLGQRRHRTGAAIVGCYLESDNTRALQHACCLQCIVPHHRARTVRTAPASERQLGLPPIAYHGIEI